MTYVKVFVLPHGDAQKFIPEIPSLAIRIFDTFPDNDGTQSLEECSNWVKILNYTFDDIEVNRYPPEHITKMLLKNPEFILFNKDLSDQICEDFSYFKDVEQLIVHCTFGWKRSPAVTRALQEIFNLDMQWGNERTARIMDFIHEGLPWRGNEYVYHLMKQELAS